MGSRSPVTPQRRERRVLCAPLLACLVLALLLLLASACEHAEDRSSLRALPRRQLLATSELLLGLAKRNHIVKRNCKDGDFNTHFGQPALTKKAIPWHPQPGKYLMHTCLYGQLSNQLICTQKHFLVAALLNRTLVMPPRSFLSARARGGWAWDVAVDVAHACRCLGERTVITLAQARSLLGLSAGADVAVGKLACMAPACNHKNRADWRREARQQGIVFPEADKDVPVDDMHSSLADVLQYFAGPGLASVAVLSAGDLYRVQMRRQTRFQVSRPFAAIRSSCDVYIMPHPVIVRAADGLLAGLLARNFLALHLRRGDFCRQPDKRQFYPIADVANLLVSYLENVDSRMIFIATNSHREELGVLRKLVAVYLKGGANFTRLPPITTHEGSPKWARDWAQSGFEKSNFARATLDKLICTRGKWFIGTHFSTFSGEIHQKRYAMGTRSCLDGDMPVLMEALKG